MTRIALVHPYSWPAVRRGGERYLHDLAWYLTGQGADVDIVISGRPGIEQTADGRIVRLRQLRPLRVGRLTTDDVFGLSALAWLARHRYDVVHALIPTAALAAVTARQPIVYTALGHPTAETIGRRKGDRAMFRATVRRTGAPLALSASAADHIEQLSGRRPRVVPPGLRISEFPLRDEPRVGPPRILFPANASDQRKCLDVMLAAFPAVLDRHPDAELLLGGGGGTRWAFDRLDPAERDRVQRATRDIGAGDLGDVAARYAEATVSVLPSVDEAFGLVLVEALATGTPVVGVASGGPTEIVDDPLIGRLAKPRDPETLADAICAVIELAADPATAGRCNEHARRWDWTQTVGPLHLDVYASVNPRVRSSALGVPESRMAVNAHGVYAIPRSSEHRPAAAAVLSGQVWERETVDLLRACDPTGDVVHAGTFFGDFIPAIARSRTDGARVYAFEPNSENFRCAQTTVELNHLDNVVLTNAALDDHSGSADLAIRSPGGLALGGGSRLVEATTNASATEKVRLTSIDEVVPADRHVAVVQLDVEGHEQEALLGALATIRRCRPLLVLESRPEPEWLDTHLGDLGYTMTDEVCGNAVFSPNSRG